MSESENLLFTVCLLWIAATVAFTMKFYKYLVTADLMMGFILLCFTALAVRHNVPPPSFGIVEAADNLPAQYVIKAGDGFYHSLDCERVQGCQTMPYDPRHAVRRPCIDCVLPDMDRKMSSLR